MSNEQVLKNWRGKIIGYVETKPNGDKTIRDFYRVIKGFYNKKLDVTRDWRGIMVAKGDCLTMLLNDSTIKNESHEIKHHPSNTCKSVAVPPYKI